MAEETDGKATNIIKNRWLRSSNMPTVGQQIRDHSVRSLPDWWCSNLCKQGQSEADERSELWAERVVCWPQMINTRPPATSIAVAPEAFLEAAELQHCLICSVLHKKMCETGRRGATSCCCPSNPFYFPQPQHAPRNVASLWQQTTEHEEWGRDFWLLMLFHKEHHTNIHTRIKCNRQKSKKQTKTTKIICSNGH